MNGLPLWVVVFAMMLATESFIGPSNSAPRVEKEKLTFEFAEAEPESCMKVTIECCESGCTLRRRSGVDEDGDDAR